LDFYSATFVLFLAWTEAIHRSVANAEFVQQVQAWDPYSWRWLRADVHKPDSSRLTDSRPSNSRITHDVSKAGL